MSLVQLRLAVARVPVLVQLQQPPAVLPVVLSLAPLLPVVLVQARLRLALGVPVLAAAPAVVQLEVLAAFAFPFRWPLLPLPLAVAPAVPAAVSGFVRLREAVLARLVRHTPRQFEQAVGQQVAEEEVLLSPLAVE